MKTQGTQCREASLHTSIPPRPFLHKRFPGMYCEQAEWAQKASRLPIDPSYNQVLELPKVTSSYNGLTSDFSIVLTLTSCQTGITTLLVVNYTSTAVSLGLLFQILHWACNLFSSLEYRNKDVVVQVFKGPTADASTSLVGILGNILKSYMQKETNRDILCLNQPATIWITPIEWQRKNLVGSRSK